MNCLKVKNHKIFPKKLSQELKQSERMNTNFKNAKSIRSLYENSFKEGDKVAEIKHLS